MVSGTAVLWSLLPRVVFNWCEMKCELECKLLNSLWTVSRSLCRSTHRSTCCHLYLGWWSLPLEKAWHVTITPTYQTNWWLFFICTLSSGEGGTRHMQMISCLMSNIEDDTRHTQIISCLINPHCCGFDSSGLEATCCVRRLINWHVTLHRRTASI